MKQFFFQVIGLVIVIFGALYFASNQNLIPKNNSTQTPADTNSENPNPQKILHIIDGSSNDTKRIKAEINIEIADTKEKKALGLGGRQSLASDSGMLFLYEKPDKYKFWMKGMKIPLDFIWINDSRIVDLLENIEPPKVTQKDEDLPLVAPIVAVDKILEVNADFVDSHNIKVGDKIEF